MENGIVKQESALQEFSRWLKIDSKEMITTLKDTLLKGCTDAEFQMSIMLCNKYKLDPFRKEIHFMRIGGKIVNQVGYDGYARIINEHPELDGIEFIENKINSKVESVTCKIYKKNFSHPVVITEYLSECCMPSSEAWKKYPVRMLRNKALIQCARLAFSMSEIVDPDEVERIKSCVEPKGKPKVEQPKSIIQEAEIVDEVKQNKDVTETLIEEFEAEQIEIKDEKLEKIKLDIKKAQSFLPQELNDLLDNQGYSDIDSINSLVNAEFILKKLKAIWKEKQTKKVA